MRCTLDGRLVCALVAACALVSPALAQVVPLPLVVAVGETTEREVGYAIGVRCDDPTIVRVQMTTPTPEANVFVVTGVKPGRTLCRVGTDPHRPSYLYEVRIMPASKKPAAPRRD